MLTCWVTMAGAGLFFMLVVAAIGQAKCEVTATGATSDWRYQTSREYKTTTGYWRYGASTEYSTNCGTRYYYSSEGTLSSPNYPRNYPNNEYCEWIIKPGTYVYLKVTDLQLESCCDHLEINDNNLSSLATDYIYGNDFRIVFKTDGSGVYRGFQLHWSWYLPSYSTNFGRYYTDDYRYRTSTPDWRYISTGYPCGTTTYSPSGVLESPNYPFGYSNNLYCVYNIRTATISQLKIEVLDLEYKNDYLEITYTRPWGHREHVRLTGTNRGQPLIGRDFQVIFTTDQSVSKKGFQLFWRTYTSQYGLTTDVYRYYTNYPITSPGYSGTPPTNINGNCGGDYMATYVVLEAPGYPYEYPPNSHCVYTINSPVDVKLAVEMLQLERSYDTLRIVRDYDNPYPTLERTLTGNDTGSSWTGRQFRVEFKSDGGTQYSEGYRIVISPASTMFGESTTTATSSFRESTTTALTTCEGSYIAREGVIESPNYPSNYPNNVDCWYYIYTSTEAILEVENYDLEPKYDFLYIVNDNNVPERTLSGSGQRDYSRLAAHFRVHFTSDSSNARKGFRLVWRPAATTSTPRGWWGETSKGIWGWGLTTATTYSWLYSTGSGDRISVNCNSRDMSVAVPRDIIRQVFPGVSEYDLTLNNPNCRGQVYSDVVIFRSSILGCDMTREETRYEVVYQNRIRTSSRPRSTLPPYYWVTTSGPVISRFDSADIKVECRLDSYATAVGFYRPQHNHELIARGHGNFTVYMDFYRDYNYNYKITSYPISLALNEDVFVDLRLDAGDPGLQIAVQQCYATLSYDPYIYNNRYSLIRSGCPVDHTVSFESSPNKHVHFRFRSFEFLKNKDQVYIFCEVNVCNDTDYYNRCHRNCNFRQRRDTAEKADHDLRVFQGPLKFRDERSADFHADEQSNKKDVPLPGSIAAVMAVSAVAMVIASVVMVIMKRKRNKREANGENRVI